MGEITDGDEWLRANRIEGPEALQQVHDAIASLSKLGPFAAYKAGQKVLVAGPTSTLVLPDQDAKEAFLKQVESLMSLDSGW